MARLLAVDDLVEALVATVDARGRWKRPTSASTSDHGFRLGQHNIMIGKRHPHDVDTRIPLVVRGPGIRPGSKIDALVTNVDLAPTFAALAGLPPRDEWDGRSLRPLLVGEDVAWRDSIPIEYYFWNREVKCVEGLRARRRPERRLRRGPLLGHRPGLRGRLLPRRTRSE